MSTLREILLLWEFEEHPFSAYTAESEPRLASYFVSPPYLDDVIGSGRSPTPSIVFGDRGIGKSAICAFNEKTRRTERAEEVLGGKVIPIRYDDFTITHKNYLKSISTDSHVRTIMHLMISSAMSIVNDALDNQTVTVDRVRSRFQRLTSYSFHE